MASADAGVTRSKTAIWLVGFEESELIGSKLPSNRQILSVFFYHHKSLKKSIRESARTAIRQVSVFWDKAKIPLRPEQHAITQLEQLHEKWVKLKKNASRQSETQQANEKAFVDGLDDLFDMAHMDALNLIKIPEDREFLIAQRERGRCGCMGPVDKAHDLKEVKAAKRRKSYAEFKKRAEEDMQMSVESVQLEDSSSTDNEAYDDNTLTLKYTVDQTPDVNPSTSTAGAGSKRARKNVVTTHVAAALDRAKVSDHKAALLLTAAAQGLGHDTKDLNINRSSIRRHRQICRSELAAHLKKEFDPTVPIVVHWDGKLLPDLTGKEKVDRLPVILSGGGMCQLIGVPKLAEGTGEAQASAVAHLLDEWKVTNRVAAMCFDTTSSNTGRTNGACVLLEQKIKRDLLYLACRHHMLELVLAAVFKASLGASSGPEVSIFKRFSEHWQFIDQTSYEAGITDEDIASSLYDHRERVTAFVLKQLEENHPRDDYRELLELCLVFLGDVPPRGVKFLAPGPVHHARWMGKALYSLKIFLFRGQFRLTVREKKGLRDVCIFITRVYIEAWFTAPLAISAPSNDLKLIQALADYKTENCIISEAAGSKFSGHLWYLSEELVGLAFYDPDVPSESKRKMVNALLQNTNAHEPQKRIQLNIKSPEVPHFQIEHFVTKNTSRFFDRLMLSTSFLETDPENWETNADYSAGRAVLKHLQVVNDSAERGVALIEEYNSILTRKENQKQFLLQVVQEHRRRFPNFNKETLSSCQLSGPQTEATD